MHFVQAKGILSAKNGMNLYRGCTHGCIYCDSRSACYQIKHTFEDIEIKENGIEYNPDTIFSYLAAFNDKQKGGQLDLF